MGRPPPKPLTIAYSDWPGWLVWEIAKQKNWCKDAGVDVNFEWADYGATIDEYSAGKVDGVLIVCGDSLTAGKPSTAIVLTDYSDGNDMLIGKQGIESIKDMKGKKVGVERNLVEHILLDKALEDNMLKEDDVTVVDIKTNRRPQTLSHGRGGRGRRLVSDFRRRRWPMWPAPRRCTRARTPRASFTTRCRSIARAWPPAATTGRRSSASGSSCLGLP